MEPEPENVPSGGQGRPGTAWVVAQSILMIAWVAAGPGLAGDWHSPLGIGLGVSLLVAAGMMGVTGVVQLGRNRTPFPRPRPGSVLVRRGLYSHCRHPLYTSVWLAGFGWALLWQSGLAMGLAILQVPFFIAKSREEERLLILAFPEYKEYARQVKGFLPGVF